MLFSLVANRALAPSWKLAATSWATHDVHVPGLGEVSEDACYRAMDWLLSVEDTLARAVFDSVADLFNLEVDLLFFDSPATRRSGWVLERGIAAGSRLAWRVMIGPPPAHSHTLSVGRQVTVARPAHAATSQPPSASRDALKAIAPPEGLSPLSARILDQLSLTAWLPAALVVANVYLVAGMYWVRGSNADPTFDNLKEVVVLLNEKPLGVLLAVVFGIVLVALITQSFEFAAIRFLEGYWGGSALAAIPTWLGTKVQALRIWLLDRRADKVEARAFRAASEEVSHDLAWNPDLANAVLLVAANAPTSHLSEGLLSDAHDYFHEKRWMLWAPPHLRHRANSLSVRRAAYPDLPSRLMPTRLGNALRSAEDQIGGDVAGSKMRGYLYEHLDSFGPVLMQQHNQYRNRLDMYAVMSVLAFLLAIPNAVLLPEVLPSPAALVTAAGLLALSYCSYRGAVSAALDYGPILLAMDRAIGGSRR